MGLELCTNEDEEFSDVSEYSIYEDKYGHQSPIILDAKSTDIPHWLRFKCIDSGYRVCPDHVSCLKTVLMYHNETVNIWTMIAVNVFSLAFMIFALNTFNPSGWDKVPFIALFLSAFVHLPFSIGYHIFMPVSPEILNRWRRLDLAFIFVAGTILAFALCFFVFPVQVTLIILGIATFITVKSIGKIKSMKCSEKVCRNNHTTNVGILCALYCLPILYVAFTDILRGDYISFSVIAILTIISALLVGAMVYVKSWPECHYAQKYDLFGNSHNIMHFCITIAHIAECVWLYKIYIRKVSS